MPHETFGCGAVPNKGCMPSGRNWSALYLIYLVSATSSCFLTGCMSWMKGLALWLQGKSWLRATILPRQFSSKKGRKVVGAHPEELLLMPYRKLGSCAVRIKQGRQLIQVASPRDSKIPRKWLCRRLTKLTLKDIVKPKKPAELDVKAAQCRYFTPLLPKLTEAKLGHVKMYFLHKTVIFHCHVSLQEGNSLHVKNRLS